MPQSLPMNEFGHILDVLSDVNIYAVNVDTFEVEFISKPIDDYITDDMKCWEAIYGLDSKCSFCKIKTLQEKAAIGDSVEKFEVFNELYNKWYNVTEKLIKFNKKTLKYSAWTDISELKEVQNNLTETYAQLVIKNNQIERLNLVLQDQVEDEMSKNKLKDELLFQQSKHAQMGEMISTIAHQMKQPLNAINIISSSMQLKAQLGMDLDISSECENIQNQIAFTVETIDLFRNFFNPNKKKESVLLSTTINQCLHIIKDLCLSINFTREFDETLHDISIYPNEIIQVCMNIIKNAKDVFDEKEQKNREIKIKTFADGQFQIIEISDNAGGVPESIIDKIFDPYFTTKDEHKGTGIGLNMSKTIIDDKHEGKLSVENRNFYADDTDSVGACFIIKLPTSLKH